MVTQSIPLVADLRSQNRNIGTIYLATGLVTEGDTGGGIYFWNPLVNNPDDGFYYIQVAGVTNGRWTRMYTGSNIYNSNGSLLGNRELTLNGSYLKFIGSTSTSTFNSNGTITLGSLSGANTRMVVANSTGLLSTQSFVPGSTIRFVEKLTATLGQTIFNTTNTLYADLFDVFLNGVKLNSDSFSFTANQITLFDGAYADDVIDVVGFSSVTIYATIPSQTGNAGKYLFTDGVDLSWQTAGGISSIGVSMPSGFTVSNSPLTANGTIAITGAGTTAQYLRGDGSLATFPTIPSGTVTSVGLTMPSAFSVANSPVTSAGTLTVTGAGTAAQYVRGDGQLATFPSTASGGSSVNYYLNGSVNASVAGYKQLANTATIGGGTDFTLVGNGLIAQFLTDSGNPNRVEIPGGAWNFEMYFQVSSSGGNQKFYVELLKYNGTTFTSIASGITVPEEITGGTSIDLYLTSLAVPTTALLVTDRLAIRVYIVDNAVGRTITLHTEDNTLCEIITTFSGGIAALNGLSANTQYLATGTSGTDFNISSLTDTHTFNLPTASATNRGALSSTDWSTFNAKVPSTRTLTINGTAYDLSADRSWTIAAGVTGSGIANQLTYWNGTGSVTGSAGLVYNDSTGSMTLSKNQNAVTDIVVSNTTYGIASRSRFRAINNDSKEAQLLITAASYTGYGALGASTAAIYTDVVSGLAIFADENAPIRFLTGTGVGNTEKMRLTAAGRLLLGTVSEGTNILEVVGNSQITNGTLFVTPSNSDVFAAGISILQSTGANAGGTYYIKNNTNTTFLGGFGTAANDLRFANYVATGKMLFYTNGSDRMTLTAAGRLLLGTVSESTYILDVSGTTRLGGDTRITGETTIDNNFYITGSGSVRTIFVTAYTAGLRLSASSSIGNFDLFKGFGYAQMSSINEVIRYISPSHLFGGTTYVSSALVNIESTTQGFLPPRMTTTQKNAIGTPAAGLQVYDTTLNSISVYDGTSWRNDTDTVTTNRQAASYTLALTDRGKLVEMNVATANNLTVPLNSSIAFPIGTKIDIAQYGTGQTTVVATGGVTIRSAGGALKLATQYSGASLVKIGTDEWYLFGDITV